MEKEIFSYNDFRCAWYSFLSLLGISLNENARCDICGTVPETVVCDATSLGHQKRFLALGLSDVVHEAAIPRYS